MMSVEEACRVILGDKAANAIIDSWGLRWAVDAAMVEILRRTALREKELEAIAALDQARSNGERDLMGRRP